MRTSPSIVPGDDQDIYLVEDDLGYWGRVWTETDSGSTDLETVIIDMLSGQYRNPVRVVAFNVSEGWCRDASKNVAIMLRRRCDQRGRKLPTWLEGFVDRHRSETS
jgi:hypothetical protein